MPQPWNADNRRRFWGDVRRGRELTASDDPIEAYIRQRGLRILLQTSESMSDEKVQALERACSERVRCALKNAPSRWSNKSVASQPATV